MYGSSRIGLLGWNKAIPTRVMLPQSETDTLSDWYLLGSRYYELTNHLGNVLSVITDKKFGVDDNSDEINDYFSAEVLSQNDYYPFGMLQPGRSVRTIPYPYLFNGKRMENVELFTTNIYDYGMRSYDARIGRFYSVDPLTRKYPWNSPYAFSENSPIAFIDLDGLERYYYQKANGELGVRIENPDDHQVYLMSYTPSKPIDHYVPINQFKIDSKANSRMMKLFIGSLVHKAEGKEYLVREYGYSSNYPDKNAVAYSFPKKKEVLLNTNRELSNDYYDLLNSVEHEIGHLKMSKESSLENHANVYLYGFSQPSFDKSSESYRLGTVASFTNFLYNIYINDASLSLQTIKPYIKKFNSLKTGISIIPKFNGPTNRGGLNLYIKNNSSTYLAPYKKINQNDNSRQ